VNPADSNLDLLEFVAGALDPLLERFVFVRGFMTGMLMTNTAAAPVRATRDVEVLRAAELPIDTARYTNAVSCGKA
jgi:hypothetical protein